MSGPDRRIAGPQDCSWKSCDDVGPSPLSGRPNLTGRTTNTHQQETHTQGRGVSLGPSNHLRERKFSCMFNSLQMLIPPMPQDHGVSVIGYPEDVSWRKIPISLVGTKKGEGKAHACAIA